MFLPTLVLLTLTGACWCTDSAHPPGTSGTVLTAGRLDAALRPVVGAFYIPEGQSSGHLHASHYACDALSAIQVTALSDTPPTIELVDGLESGVNVFGCGPVVVTLAHACRLKDNSEEKLSVHFPTLGPVSADDDAVIVSLADSSEFVPDPALGVASDDVPSPAIRSASVLCPWCNSKDKSKDSEIKI